MKIIKQIIRGCGTLPHVGDHPGTLPLFLFILFGGVTGRQGGIFSILGGMAFMGVIFVPVYLYGAYDRANFSDKLVKKELS